MRRSIVPVFVCALLTFPVAAQLAPASPIALEEAEARASLAEESLANLETRRNELSAALETQETQTVARVRALYRLRRGGALPVAGGFDAMLSHLSRLGRLERLVAQDADRRRTLRDERVEVERAYEVAVVERDDAQAALASLRTTQMPTHGLASYFDPTMTPPLPIAQIPALQSATAPTGAPATFASGSAPPPPQYGLTIRGSTRSAFPQARGRLPLPVRGGSIADASREDGSGVEFQSNPGRAVRPVAEGTIAFSQFYGAYGNMVIVDHGGSHYTVYSGLRTMSVSAGAQVNPGSELGRVGDVPLYFEVRRGTRSLDARAWLGL